VKRLLRLTLGLVTAAIITLGFTSAANAQSIVINCPYGGCVNNITINNFIVLPGGVIVLNGSGFLPNAVVTVTVASTPTVVGTPTTNAEGAFTLSFDAPTEPGAHTITATDGVNTQVIAFTVEGETAAAVDSAGSLPYTGSDSSVPVAQIGAGLVAAGAVLVLMVRKRQHHLASVKVDA
jgi:LPXTG-motif cell wall-anchored protein